MHLLVITPFYAPDLGPSAPLVTMLCEDLVAMGYQVTALVAVPHFPDGQVATEYRGHLWQWEQRQGVQVCRVWVPSGRRANLGHRLIVFFTYQVLATLIGAGLRYDATLVTNPAVETLLPFAVLAWARRKPAVFCVWDLYPEVGVQLGIFRKPWLINLVAWMEDFCLHRAAAVHLITDSFTHNIQKRGVLRDKIFVIQPWIDTQFFLTGKRHNDFSQKYELDAHFVVMHAGNMGFSQDLENVLRTAKVLSDYSSIQFVMVGDGPCREPLIELKKQLGLTNVHFLPFQPRKDLPDVLATADISLVSLLSGVENGSLPSKTFPILASGRPILAIVDQDSDLCRLITHYGAGHCVPPGEPEILASLILDLFSNSEKAKDMGINGRVCAEKYHSRGIAASTFKSVFQEIA